MRFLLAAMLLAAPGAARAAFVDLGAGARAPGMSGAFTAIADDVYAIHYNPAGLAQLDRPEFGTSYTRLFMGLTDNSDLSHAFVGYAHPLKDGMWGTVGAAWQQFALNTSLYQEQTYTLSYARLMFKDVGPGRLYGGASAKYLRRSFGYVPEASNAMNGLVATGRPDPVLTGRNAVGVPDADVGLLYRLEEHYAVGLDLQHVPQPNVAFSPADSDRLPLATKLGFNYRSLLSDLALQYETVRSPIGTRDHNLAMGVERWFPRLMLGDFGLRGGLEIGSRDLRTVNAGLTYRTRRVGVDYAFAMPLGTVANTAGTHRIAISFRFGSLREPDESVVMILEAMRQLKKGAVPELRALGVGLTKAQRALLEEQVALAKSLQDQAKYQAALERLGQALAVSPGDTDLLKAFGRLNWVAQQLKELPDYKSDPVQSSWHKGVLAYLASDPAAAIEKVANALGLQPDNKALDGFLSQLELATGLKRPVIPQLAQRFRIEQLLARAASAIEDGRYNDAIELAKEVLQEEAQNLGAWEDLGTSYFAIGDYPNSLDAWEKAFGLEKDPARKTALRGYIKSIRGLLARPTPVMRPAPPQPSTTEERARPEVRVRATPEQIQRLYNAGVDLYTSGQLEKARDVFQEVLRLDPGYVPASKALRRVQEELSQR